LQHLRRSTCVEKKRKISYVQRVLPSPYRRTYPYFWRYLNFLILCKVYQLLQSVAVIFRRPFVKRFALRYRTIVCPVCPALSVCDVGVWWPNDWMDHDATWYGGRPRPRPHCAKWRPSFHPKGAEQSHHPHFSTHVYCGQTVGGSIRHLVRR